MPDTANASGIQRIRYILIVDNNTNDLFIASMLLQRFHYQVCTANTAGQALDMVSVAVPSMILAELSLPGMSGMDLLSVLRQDPRTVTVPVLFMFDGRDATAERRCRSSSQASGAIPKPIDVEELYRQVQLTIESTPRSHIRMHTSLEVSVNGELLNHVVGDCVSVLSEHGMYIKMKKPCPRNARLSIQVKLNGRSIPAESTVLYSHSYGEGPFKEPGMGIKFSRIDPEDREYIRAFIRTEMMKGIDPRANI